MVNGDGKVVICTKLNNTGLEKDLKKVSGEFGGLGKTVERCFRTISGAMSKPVSQACAKIQKDINAAERQIKQCQQQIQKAESAKMPLVEQAEQLGVELDTAKAKLVELQAQQQAAGNILSAADGQEMSGADVQSYLNAYEQKPQLDADVAQQQAQVDALQKKWDAVNDKIDAYNSKINQANKEMEEQKDTAAKMAQKLDSAEKKAKKIREDSFGAKKGFSSVGKAVDSFASRLKKIALGALLFNGISAGLREFTSYLNEAFKTNDAFRTELAQLKGALLTAFQPIYNAVAPAVISLMQILTKATLVVAQFFATLTGTTLEASASAANALYEEANGLKAVGGAAKKAKKSLAGIDELNVLQDKNEVSGSTGGDSNVATPDFSFDDTAIEGTIEDIRGCMEAILVLVGLIGAGILAWNILDAVTGGTNLKNVFADIGSKALVVVGAVLLIKGYCDGWVNGVDWGNLALTLGGIAVILAGVYLQFGTLGVQIGAVAAGVAMLVLGVKDFIDNGPSIQNTIMIIGGAVAIAVAAATMGLGLLVGAILGAVAAVAAFTAAILLEEPAIMSVQEAQKNLTAAKQAAAEAENGYINAVDAAESALTRLKVAEEAAGITGAELYAQVQSGTLDYAEMTAAQKEVYKAYLDNEKKQQELKAATEELSAAKKAETIASFENQLALAQESGSYDEFKKSVVAAFEEGTLSADEARELIGKSMSEMSDDAQKTFMVDVPSAITDGLDPSQYETTKKKMGDWFRGAGTFFIENIWNPVKDFWNRHIAPIFTWDFWLNLAKDCVNGLISGFEGGINGIISMFESMINWVVRGLNKISFNIPDWVPGIGGKSFGFNIPTVRFNRVAIPRLAQGAVIPPNREFMAVLGDQRHGTNIEAPLTTIQEAVANVMNENLSAMMAGFNALLEENRLLRQVVESIEVGDAVIGQANQRYMQKMAIIRGGQM